MRETEGFRPSLFILHYSSFIIHYWVYRPDKPKFESMPPKTKIPLRNREGGDEYGLEYYFCTKV